MVTYENECVGCPPEKGCLGSTCPYRKVKHYIAINAKRIVEHYMLWAERSFVKAVH